jgi:hypothetical protein
MENIGKALSTNILSLSSQRVRCRMSRLQDYRLQEYRLPSPPSIKCNVLHESLSEDSQNIPCATKGVVGNLYISLAFTSQRCQLSICHIRQLSQWNLFYYASDKFWKNEMESVLEITSVYPFWMEGGTSLLLLWRDHWSVLPAFTILVLVFLLMHLSQEYTLFNGIQYSPFLPCTVCWTNLLYTLFYWDRIATF